MGVIDLIIFPFYVIMAHFIFMYIRRGYTDPILRKYHRNAFWVKIFATVAFTVFNAYLSPGDSVMLYFDEGAHMYHRILGNFSDIKLLTIQGIDFDETLLANPWNKGYFNGESNYLTTKLVVVASFVTMGKYMTTNLAFSLVAFTGMWKLFLFFYLIL